MMMDFVRFGDKDPMLFIAKKESFYEFSQYMEPQPSTLNDAHRVVLKLMSLELSNGKRIEEILILRHVLAGSSWSTADLAAEMERLYGFLPSTETMDHAARVLSLQFFGKKAQQKYGGSPLLSFENHVYRSTPYFESLKQNAEFKAYVHDVLDYGTYRFESLYIQDDPDIVGGFVRYGRYSRKDVSRILNYDTNREGTLNGYQIVGHTCPIFVTYEKCDDISANTKYEDRFISPQEFSWMTRARVRLTSSQIPAIQDSRTRKLLFVKKSDAEGSNFYYIGDLKVLGDSVETTIANDAGVQLPIVNFRFVIDKPVEEKLYTYLCE